MEDGFGCPGVLVAPSDGECCEANGKGRPDESGSGGQRPHNLIADPSSSKPEETHKGESEHC